MRKQILFLLLVLFALNSKSQTVINGEIVDSLSRQPLEAAYVQQEGNGAVKTLTDHYGNFSIKINSKNATLTASFIGYKPKTINIAGQKEIKIELKPDAVNLKDVFITQSTGTLKFAALAKVDLDLKPVRNTQELMRLVPGLFVAQHAGGGKAEQIFLRGFDCDHGTDIAVSVDGLPVNMVSHAHGQGYADSHFIIPETVNNIDYGAGPYYTQHGNLCTAGYINFSTYTNIPQSRVQVEAGLFNTYRTLAMVDLLKKNKDKQSAYIAGEFYYTNGPSDNPQNFNRFNLFGKYNLAISRNTQLTASLSGFKSKWDASGQIPTRAVEEGLIDRFGSIDPSEGGHTQRYNANIILAHKFMNGTTWENQIFYTKNIFSLYSDFTFFLIDSVHGDEINQAESRNMIGYSSKLNHKYFFNNWSLNSTYGVGFRYDATDSTILAHVEKRQFLNYINLGKIKELNAYGYIDEQINSGKWSINAGVRFDYLHFNYFYELGAQQPAQGKSIVCPKLNIQYTFNPQVQLYVKAGKGFHSNDTRVVVANNGYQILPAAYGADLGITLKPTDKFLLNVAAWYLYLQQEFVYNGDDANVEPSGATVRDGIDIIARYQFSNTLFANANINFTKPRALNVAKGHNFIGLAPTTTSTGGIFYKKKYGINGSISYRYIADRSANEDNSIIAKGYFITDGSINYTRPKYEVGLAFENIFNTKWNEAQFATESRLLGEPTSITELDFTPGIPFFVRAKLAVFF
ncbi:MAG: carboxypeptidase-like regulatory domain-containing protein [Chitinophagaceae bacterium]